MKIFVDTNIFLDLILKRNSFQDSLLIFNAVEKRLFTGVILDITILNIDYIAKQQIKEIKNFISLVNQNFFICGVSNDMIEDALKIHNKDFEDTLQYLSAKLHGCDVIITNDKNFYSSDLQVMTSAKFVAEYMEQS